MKSSKSVKSLNHIHNLVKKLILKLGFYLRNTSFSLSSRRKLVDATFLPIIMVIFCT